MIEENGRSLTIQLLRLKLLKVLGMIFYFYLLNFKQ